MNESKPTLRRSLGTMDGVFLLVGITIGSGIFSTPQGIANSFESFRTIAFFWLLCGAFMYVGGLIYAELGTRLPETGGEYVYLSRAFGPHVAFMFVWSQLLIIRTSPAAGLAIIATDYLGNFFLDEAGNSMLTGPAHTAICIAIIAALGTVNVLGVRRAAAYQAFSSIFKVGGLLLLVAVGAAAVMLGRRESLLGTTAPPTAGFGLFGNAAVAMMMIAFSYLGFDRVGYVAGEMKNPRRAIPLTMFFGIAAITVVYLLANTIYHQVLGMEGVRGDKLVAATTARQLAGPIGAGFVAIVVIVSATGSINGTMMTATRAYYANAHDGRFFGFLDRIHPTFLTPARAIVVHCVWAVVILFVRKGNFQDIISGMTFVLLFFYGLTTLALFKLRREGIGEEGSYRMPLYPILPIIYLIGIIVLLSLRGYFEWGKTWKDLLFVLSGVPFAIWYCRKGARPAEA